MVLLFSHSARSQPALQSTIYQLMWIGAFHSMAAGEYTHYTKTLKRERRSSFRKEPSSIHVFIGSDTCCSRASRHSDWEAVGTSRETLAHTHRHNRIWEHKTFDRKTIDSQIGKQTHRNRWERDVFPTTHTHTHTFCGWTHTLLAGFSVLLAAGSGCSCLPFLDGVLLILGEWNLSISFMVKEDRWDRCESMDRGRTDK